MAQTRFERGSQTLASIDGAARQDVVNSLADIVSNLGRWIVEFTVDGIYTRPELDAQQRELVTLGSLVTQGDVTSQLKVHISEVLNVGLSEEEVVEALLQCAPHVGFPRVINAVNLAREVFQRRVNQASATSEASEP